MSSESGRPHDVTLTNKHVEDWRAKLLVGGFKRLVELGYEKRDITFLKQDILKRLTPTQ